jgi:hypothetical protein
MGLREGSLESALVKDESCHPGSIAITSVAQLCEASTIVMEFNLAIKFNKLALL